MSLEDNCQQSPASENLSSVEKQEGPSATGGRPITLVSMAALRRLSVINTAVVMNRREDALSPSECCCCSNPTQNGKPELQSMEGTLGRKQKLQLGGKKVGFHLV